MRALHRRFGKQDAVIGNDSDRVAEDVGEAAYQRGSIKRLEFVELACVHDAGNHLARVERFARIGGYHAMQFRGFVQGLTRLAQLECNVLSPVQVRNDAARQFQCMQVV